MAYFTTTDGVRIYYEEHGTGEPLLLAYGIGGNAGMWQPNVAALAALSASILWEPRGHARSDAPRTPRASPSATGRWTSTISSIIWRSTGGGGRALPRRRHRHPLRPRAPRAGAGARRGGLVLGGRPAAHVDNVVMRARSIQVVLEGGMDAMAEFAIASNPNVAGRLKLDPGAREEVFAMYRMLKPVGYANALRALLQMDYITERLPEITVPTLLVCGDEDPSLGPMRVMAQKIKHAGSSCSRPPATSPTATSRRRSTARCWTSSTQLEPA